MPGNTGAASGAAIKHAIEGHGGARMAGSPS